MDPIKKNIFVVATEYHLLMSLAIIFQEFTDCKRYENIIIIGRSKKRLLTNLNFSEFLPNLRAVIIETDFNNKLFSWEIKRKTKDLTKTKINRLFYFLEYEIISLFLISRLKKKGTIICLCEDGMFPYAKTKGGPFKSRLKSTFLLYLAFGRHLIFFNKLLFKKTGFGKHKHNDEYWLSMPEALAHCRNKRPVKKINSQILRQNNSKILQLFNWTEPRFPLEKFRVFYLNQPLPDETVKFECERIFPVLLNYGEVVIKPHPHTSQFAINNYKVIKGVKIIQVDLPAEIFILSFSEKFVVSPWSTALLLDNPSCKFFWLYPIFFSNLSELRDIQFPTTPAHIIVVDDFQSLNTLNNVH